MRPFHLNPLHLFMEERERWFYWLPIGMVAGIVAYFALPFEPLFPLIVASPVLGLMLVLARRSGAALALLSLPFFFALGFNAAQLETRLSASPMLDETLEVGWFHGRLMKAEALPEGSRLLLKYVRIHDVEKEENPLFLRVKVKEKLADFPEPGAKMSFWGQVWPFSEPLAPGGYDFRRRFFFDQLGGTAASYGEVRSYDDARPLPFFWDGFHLLFERARRAIALRVFERLEGPTGAMTATLLSGSQTGIDKDTMQAMRTSGLSHLLSISGVHVSMMGLLVYIPLRALLALFPFLALRFPIKKWAAGAAMVAAFLYTFLVGPETPTVRSALMTAIVLFAIIVDRRAMSLRLVALSAIFLMMIAPSDVMGPSFEMSFAAVLAMVVAFEKRIDHPEKEKEYFVEKGPLRWLARHVRDIALTSLVATAATAPFTLYHFQNFSIYGVVANMLALPLTSFWIMPNILLTYLAMPFGFEAPFIHGTGWGVALLIQIAQEIAGWPYALFHFAAMPPWVLVVILGGGLWFLLWRRVWRYAGFLPVVLGFLYPLYTTAPDILLTEGGKKWGVMLEDGRFVTSVDPESFVARSWLQLLGEPPSLSTKEFRLEDKKASAFVTEGEGALRCGRGGCLLKRGDKKIAFLRSEKAAHEVCGKVDVIVADFPLPDCAAPFLLDEAAFQRRGSHALFFEGDLIRTQTVRTHEGARPWAEGWRGF